MRSKITLQSAKWMLFLFIVFTSCFARSQSNSLTLTFTAIDSITQQSLNIDSVMIENLSSSDTIVAYGPNPEITFIWTAIGEPGTKPNTTFEPATCFPNPFYHGSTVAIDVYQQQELDLSLISQSGEVLAVLSKYFGPGRHLFHVSGGGNGICLLLVKSGRESRTVKLISKSGSDHSIEYTGQTGLMKSVELSGDFNFTPGDTLKYTMYTDGYFNFVASDAPSESIVYTWELIPVTFYDPPTVMIDAILAITHHSATCSASVTDNGGTTVTSRGFCWSTSPEPTINNHVTTTGQGMGNYIGNLTELTPGTEYYVRAWAANIAGTAYSEETLVFMSSCAALYVPGEYQGWDPSAAPVIYDFDNDSIYTGYIFFPPAVSREFKFTSAPNWDYMVYGSGGAGLLSIDPGADNLSVPQSGGYHLEVDIQNLTWSYDLLNWGVIGQWLNWEEDIDMVWDIETQQLSVTVEDIPAAEDQRFVFRANDGWDYYLGAIDPPDGQTLMWGGSDIPIPEGGSITFILQFTTPMPTYELIYLR
ncbi:MAG: hypothetical protein ACLFPE_01295 [Bacteroidales bacterium]